MGKRPTREEILHWDRRHVWRPFCSIEEQEQDDPWVIVDAEGSWLYDADGRRYLDAHGGWWVNNLGHRHPRLQAALRQQLEGLIHCSMADTTHEAAAYLAKELVEATPQGLDRVFFSDDGSTAVEVALKIAYQYWQQNGRPSRRRFISLAGAYHGDTLGAMSVGGIQEFRQTFGPMLFEVLRPSPGYAEAEWKQATAHIETCLRERPEEIAGVIVEPLIQGVAGMRFWSPELLRRLRQATQAADTFLIADEIFTGLGRSGRMWACEHAEVSPDLLCSAKWLSGGTLPFAVTLASERIYDGFRGGRERALLHGHSYCGNPLGASVAREVLRIYREEALLERARSLEAKLGAGVRHIAERYGALRPRAWGAVAALDLGPPGYLSEHSQRIRDVARHHGLCLRPLGSVLYVAPPLTLSESECEFLLQGLEATVAELGPLPGVPSSN